MTQLICILLTLLISLSGPAMGENSGFGRSSFAANTAIYRVEGLPNTRIIIGEGGQVAVQGDQMLFLNFGDKARAEAFLAQRTFCYFRLTPTTSPNPHRSPDVPSRPGGDHPE